MAKSINYGTDRATYSALVPTMDRIEKDAAEYYMAFAAAGLDTPTLARPYVVEYVERTHGYPTHPSRNGGLPTFVSKSKGDTTLRYLLDKIFQRGYFAHTEKASTKAEEVKVPAALKATMKSVFDAYSFEEIDAAYKAAKVAKRAAIAAAKAKAAAK